MWKRLKWLICDLTAKIIAFKDTISKLEKIDLNTYWWGKNMKNKKYTKGVVLIMMFVLFSGLVTAGNALLPERQAENANPTENNDKSTDGEIGAQQNSDTKLQPLYIPHPPISINGNSDFTPANGVTRGDGTAGNPYIIENWDIDGRGGGRVIYIGNTTAYFVVQNCYLHNGGFQSYPYLLGAGIQLYNVQNGLLENNNCSSNYYGIYLHSSSSNTLTYNTCNSNTCPGIYLRSSLSNTLTYNNCSNNHHGIHLFVSSSNTLIYNTCNLNNGNGIFLESSSGNTLTYNNCSNNYHGICLWRSSSNTLAYNAMTECGLFVVGDTLSDYFHTIDITNTVNGKPIYYYKNQTGITVPPDAGEVILVNCTNFIVENLVLNNGSVGIELAYSSHGTVKNTICSSNNVCGIYLDHSSSNTLTCNNCSNNRDGIYLRVSSSNRLTYNNIEYNIYHGVWSDKSNSNRIHHNNFINNRAGGAQAYDDTGTNFWDDTTEGNYWSDYTTRYPNANQIGNVWDTPYEIGGGAGAKDYYPLIGQVQIPVSPSPLLIIVAVILLFFVTDGVAKKIAQRRAGLRATKQSQ